MITYALYPIGQDDLQNKIFLSPYRWLKDHLAKRDIDLQTYDQIDVSQAKKVLFFNHQPASYTHCLALGIKPEQLVLFLMEPRVVIPEQYKQRVWNAYGQIFTYLDNLVDNKKFFKMLYPQGQILQNKLLPWSKRKFLTLINANKYSYVTNELYSARRQAIAYFSKDADFDLYGRGWSQHGALNLGTAGHAARSGKWFSYVRDAVTGFKHSDNYRGTIENKYTILEQYRFTVAFENEAHVQGYITEKLFDCLFTGTVPIYWGADNITDYVPAECFIDFRRHGTFPALDKYLRSMRESDWVGLQQAGQQFLRSEHFKKWLPENVFQSIAEHL